ncbi:MAG: regulatory iron-sulfur-containing complex subunit RicT [Thermodesulfobacteriota bacterium]
MTGAPEATPEAPATQAPSQGEPERGEAGSPGPRDPGHLFSIQLRPGAIPVLGRSRVPGLHAGELVMVKIDRRLEPGRVLGPTRHWLPVAGRPASPVAAVVRRANTEETERYARLQDLERQAHALCDRLIEQHGLAMVLVRVERFFDNSKIIFYFTADNRVDFRALVRDLVRDLKIRIEMRQIGVRHESKMIGGLGHCGRELCCASYLNNFVPISIKMAKEQNLPLNPSKISGVCSRLLCCLTYEFDTYASIRKRMPKVGKSILLRDKTYKVIQHDPLRETIRVVDAEGKESTLAASDWEAAVVRK